VKQSTNAGKTFSDEVEIL